MNDIIEIENFISKDYQDFIYNQVIGLKFPWYFNPTLVSNEDKLVGYNSNIQGFNHFLFEENNKVSPFFDSLYPLVLGITEKSGVKFNTVERMRFNLTYPDKSTPEGEWHLPHIDSSYPHYNAIYYVNDSDGDTVIFEEKNLEYSEDMDYISSHKFTVKKRITPKKGKLLIFPGYYYHASSYARAGKFRCVLNINLGKLL